jgi:NAD(P)-dependent dehydrogenase (short-subunit alcohol dehydrogenase family)
MAADDGLEGLDAAMLRREFLQLSAASVAAAVGAEALGAPAGESGAKIGTQQTVCVLGASGHVGGAIVSALLTVGYRVIAISRSADKLRRIQADHAGVKQLDTLVGDVSSDAAADQLRAAIIGRFGNPHAVVSSLSSPAADTPMRILDTPTDKLRGAFETNFFSHVTAAVALIPSLQPGGVYIGISGGLSDFVVPNMGAISMTQSALRTLYSVLAQEAQDSKARSAQAQVRMLALYGLVSTDGSSGQDGRWIAAPQIGVRVSEIIARPAAFPGPLLSIKAKRYS